MNSITEQILHFIERTGPAIILSLVVIIATWRRWIDTKPSTITYSLLGYWAIAIALGLTSFFFGLIPWVGRVGWLVQSFVVVVVSVWLIRKIALNTYKSAALAASLSGRSLDVAAKELLASPAFRTALANVLPEEGLPTDHSLDSVKGLLQELDNRMGRAANGAKRSLQILSIASIFSVTIIVGAGYLVIDEYAAGTPKRIRQLGEIAQEIREKASRNSVPLWADSDWTSLVESDEKDLHRQVTAKRNSSELAALTEVLPSSHEGIAENDKSVKEMQKWLKDNSSKYPAITEAIKKFLASYDTYKRKLSMRIQKERDAMSELIKLSAQSKDDWEQSSVRAADLVKRVTVGAVVATFLLIILRYIANLYSQYYRNLVEAERENYRVRKFIIAYKTSEFNPTERQQIVQKFIESNATAPVPAEASTITKEEATVLQDVIAAIVKKG